VPTRAALTTCNGLPDHVQWVTRPRAAGSGRSLTESLQRFGVARQLLIEHLVEQSALLWFSTYSRIAPRCTGGTTCARCWPPATSPGSDARELARMARQVAMTRV